MSNSDKNILNTNNYKKEIEDKTFVLFEYNKLLNEYISHIIKQLVINDNTHYLFVIQRGFDLFKNIFIMLIHYTKNLELSVHHLRKSYLYYTEFIGQVGEDSNSFLQLNSKDACLFVYKKTIYDINEDYKKKLELTKKEKEDFFNIKENIFILTKVIKLIVESYITKEKNLFVENERNIHVKNIKLYTNKIVNELKRNTFTTDNDFNKIYNFIYFIENKNFELEKKKQLIYHFLKKINNIEINDSKLYKLIFESDSCDLSPIKFINKLFKK